MDLGVIANIIDCFLQILNIREDGPQRAAGYFIASGEIIACACSTINKKDAPSGASLPLDPIGNLIIGALITLQFI
jgi:hypothetical protein